MNQTREIIFWKGLHSKNLLSILREVWTGKQCLILCPPHWKDPSILQELPKGESLFLGDWNNEADRELKNKIFRSRENAEPKVQNDFAEAKIGIFTSGSTLARPRLALYSRANVEASLSSIYKLFKDYRYKKIFCYPQPYHTFGLSLGYLNAIAYNLEIEIAEGTYSESTHKKWVESVDTGTLTIGTPVHFLDLMKYLEKHSLEAPRSLTAIVGGAPVDRKLWQQLRDVLHIQAPSIGYGCTEASPGLTHLAPGEEPRADREIGEILEGIEITSHSEEGFLFRGPSLCWALETEDGITHPKECLIKDHIEAPEDGKKWIFHGRRDFMLNRGGEKFSLEAIETLLSNTLSLQCLALTIPDLRLGEELALLITEDSPHSNSCSSFEIQRQLKLATGRSFSGKYFFKVPQLPLTATQKKNRIAAKEILMNLSSSLLSGPFDVANFENFLPHRAPAIWVSQVEWTHEQEGCVCIDISSPPISNCLDANGNVRASAHIEWMAQAFGYIEATKSQNTSQVGAKAYLVALRDLRYFPSVNSTTRLCFVRCSAPHQFGPIAMVKCEVANENFELLSRGELRLFYQGES